MESIQTDPEAMALADLVKKIVDAMLGIPEYAPQGDDDPIWGLHHATSSVLGALSRAVLDVRPIEQEVLLRSARHNAAICVLLLTDWKDRELTTSPAVLELWGQVIRGIDELLHARSEAEA